MDGALGDGVERVDPGLASAGVHRHEVWFRLTLVEH